MSQGTVPGTFCWFVCGSTDAAKAKKFYAGLFGWTAMDVPMPGESGGNYTLLKMGNDDVAGLYEMSGPMFEGVPAHWMSYVCVENVDDTAKRAQSLRGKVVAEPMDVPGVGRVAFLEDPTGAKIALFKPGEHPGVPQSPVPGRFCWSELATRDTKAARVFYTELFNWRFKDSKEPPMEYTEFSVGEMPIGGMMPMTPQHGDAPPHWLPYVAVADCDVTAAKVSKLGGRMLVPPTAIPKVGKFSVFMDPTGAALAIVKLEEQHKK